MGLFLMIPALHSKSIESPNTLRTLENTENFRRKEKGKGGAKEEIKKEKEKENGPVFFNK